MSNPSPTHYLLVMNSLGVYKIVNLVNQKWYVGSSTDIKKRWRRHRKMLNARSHNNSKLQASWNTHGENNFEFQLLKECNSIDEALQLEQSIIDEHFGQLYFYNVSRWATLPTEEAKSKLREIANKRPKFSKESIDKCRLAGARGARKRWDSVTDEKRKEFSEKMKLSQTRVWENARKKPELLSKMLGHLKDNNDLKRQRKVDIL